MDPRSKTGIGAYVVLNSEEIGDKPGKIDKSLIESRIVIKQFADTSSTKLEIETALWALGEVKNAAPAINEGICLYSDSQCVCGLPGRRAKLESRGFVASGSGRELNHAGSYRKFYSLAEELSLDVIKVKGHMPQGTHDGIHRVFSILDRFVRQELRALIRDSLTN